MAPFSLDAGIETTVLRHACALRMRVSMSAMGSVMLILRVSLPARLRHPGHLAAERDLAQLVARQAELPEHAARTAGELAAVAQAHGRGVARQLLQRRARLGTLLVGDLEVIDDGEQLGTPGREFRDGLAALQLAVDDGCLGHVGCRPSS